MRGGRSTRLLISLTMPSRTYLIDGVFSAAGALEESSAQLRFHGATAFGEAEVVALQEAARKRVLAVLERRGLLTSEAVAETGQWEHGAGFSIDASIRVGPNDRPGLERLLRYCARPAFARERLC